MPGLVRLTGRGTAELPGYGIADAEHRLEKELSAALPGSTLRIEEIRRTDARPRIVETFAFRYALTVEVPAEAEDDEKARRMAYASARQALGGTRFEMVEWEQAVLVR